MLRSCDGSRLRSERELAPHNTLIRYDARGNGLSDRAVDDVSSEAFVRDLEGVVDAAKRTRFALLGISQGCAVSIAYAVSHPERVSRLVLYGGYAVRRNRRALTTADKEEITQESVRWSAADIRLR